MQGLSLRENGMTVVRAATEECVKMRTNSDPASRRGNPVWRIVVWASLASLVLSNPVWVDRCYGQWSEMSGATSDVLYGVWGSAADDVFAVGDDGTILHYNGSTWSAMSSGTTKWLYGVWGSSAANVLAVGEGGTIRRYNGSSWSAMSSGTTTDLYGVWGSSANNVFAVGRDGTIRRYNGSSWSAMSSGTTVGLYGVWGTSSSNVYAVGNGGTILRYNGSSWSSVSSGTSGNLAGIWGSASNNIYAVGGNVDVEGEPVGSTVVRYNGSSWSTVSVGTTSMDLLYKVWGSAANDVWAVGARTDSNAGTITGVVSHYNGSSWELDSSLSSFLIGVWCGSAAGAFAVGGDYDSGSGTFTGGAIYHSGQGQPTQYTLTCQTTGQGSINPTGGTYDDGTQVTITANASSGWHFVQWEGSLSGSTNPATVTMNADKNVSALFEQDQAAQYTLACQSIGQGSVEPSGGTFDEGTVVTVTATPADGWHFVQWQGDLLGSTNPTTVTMTANRNVSAVFEEDQVVGYYSLATHAVGQGNVVPANGTYEDGTQVTITATALEGWEFVQWQGDLLGSTNPATVTMNGDMDISAVFQQISGPTQYTLASQTVGEGSINPESGTYDQGAQVVVTAIAAEGWFFVDWQGDLAGMNNPALVTMSKNMTAVAVFQEGQKQQYSLTSHTTGQGSVDPDAGTFFEGTEITVTATPADGWKFVEWQGNLAGSSNPAIVTITDNMDVTAVFEEGPATQYALTCQTTGQGSIDPSGGTFDEGWQATLTATPDEGWQFVEWQGDLAGSDNPAHLIMSADKNVTAVFEEAPTPQYSLTCMTIGQGSVDPNSGTYDEGTDVVLTATPAEGWEFVQWQGDLLGSNNPATLTITADMNVTAVFKQTEIPTPQYTLACQTTGQGSVDPNSGTYDEGTDVTLTATPAEGWEFVQWQGDLLGSNNPATLTMSRDTDVTAVFREIAGPTPQHSLATQVVGQGSVDPSGGTFDEYTEVEITATPAEGWRFVQWQGDLTGSDNPATVTMTDDMNITAVFQLVDQPVTRYTLTCAVIGEGNTNPDSGTYDKGAEVSVAAMPAEGWRFVQWFGDATGSENENENENPVTVTMNGDRRITAVFEEIQGPVEQRTLTCHVQGQGAVEPNGGTYDERSQVTVAAVPAEGWLFVEWQGDLTGSNSPKTFTIDGDMTITALFVAIPSPESEDLPVSPACCGSPGGAAMPFMGAAMAMLSLRRRIRPVGRGRAGSHGKLDS